MQHLFIHIPHLYIHELPTKYPHKKILDLRTTHEIKFQTQKIPSRKHFGLTKYLREKKLDPQNTHEKNFGSTKAQRYHGMRLKELGTLILNEFLASGISTSVFSLNFNLTCSNQQVVKFIYNRFFCKTLNELKTFFNNYSKKDIKDTLKAYFGNVIHGLRYDFE